MSPSERIFPAVRKLLSLQVRVMLSNFRRANKKRKFGLILVWLLVLGGAALVFGLSWSLLGLLRSPFLEDAVGDLAQLLDAVPSLILSAAFFGILLTSFGVLLQALYLAGDMTFLLSSPIPIRSVFLAKLLQAILPNLAIIALFALPVLYGMGAANGYNLLYYPFVVFILVVLALAAAGISALLVMLLVRIIPPRRIAEVLGFVGAILAMILSQSGNLFNFGEFSPSDAQIQQSLSALESFNTPWIPLIWGGRGLVALGEGDWLLAGILLVPTAGISLGIFWFSLVTAERWFYTGWASMQVVSSKKKTRRRSSTRRSSRKILTGWMASNMRAIIWKDFLVLRRDLRNLSQLVTPLIFGIIYSFLLLRSTGEAPTGQDQAPGFFLQAFQIALVYSSVGIAIFVGWMLLTRLALISFSQEQNSYWILKSSPASPGQLVCAKFLVAYLPTVMLGLIFLTVISLLQGGSGGIWAYGLFVILFSNAGLGGINLAFGITGARFDWKDPRRMSNQASGCLSSLAGMLYFLVNLTLFFAPPVLFSAADMPVIYGQLLGGTLGGLVSVVCLVLPLWLVRERIPLLGEEVS
jgi:hypothetical protein